MKFELRTIVGKTIASIVVSERNAVGPPTQLFLIFDDGTTYELYGDIFAAGRLDTGGEPAALKYVEMFDGQVTRFGEDEDPLAPSDSGAPAHGALRIAFCNSCRRPLTWRHNGGGLLASKAAHPRIEIEKAEADHGPSLLRRR